MGDCLCHRDNDQGSFRPQPELAEISRPSSWRISMLFQTNRMNRPAHIQQMCSRSDSPLDSFLPVHYTCTQQSPTRLSTMRTMWGHFFGRQPDHGRARSDRAAIRADSATAVVTANPGVSKAASQIGPDCRRADSGADPSSRRRFALTETNRRIRRPRAGPKSEKVMQAPDSAWINGG